MCSRSAIAGPKSRLLVTTCDASVVHDVKLFELDTMSPQEAQALLEKRLGRTLTPTEATQAAELAKELGCLPLAFDLAAAQVIDGIPWKSFWRN